MKNTTNATRPKQKMTRNSQIQLSQKRPLSVVNNSVKINRFFKIIFDLHTTQRPEETRQWKI